MSKIKGVINHNITSPVGRDKQLSTKKNGVTDQAGITKKTQEKKLIIDNPKVANSQLNNVNTLQDKKTTNTKLKNASIQEDAVKKTQEKKLVTDNLKVTNNQFSSINTLKGKKAASVKAKNVTEKLDNEKQLSKKMTPDKVKKSTTQTSKVKLPPRKDATHVLIEKSATANASYPHTDGKPQPSSRKDSDGKPVFKRTLKRRVRARDSDNTVIAQNGNESVLGGNTAPCESTVVENQTLAEPQQAASTDMNIFRDADVTFQIEQATFYTYLVKGRYGAGNSIASKLFGRCEFKGDALYTESSNTEQYVFLENLSALYPTQYSYRLKVATNIALLDLFFCYRGWRHFKCLPLRGQRTWTNGSSASRNNKILRDLKVRVARNVYGNFGTGAISTAIFAEQYNMLWYRQWHMDWAGAKKKRINFFSKTKSVCIMDLNSTALGKISGSNRLAKPGKKKKVYKKNTFTIGFTLGSTKWMLAASQTSELVGVFKLKTGQLIQILLSTPVERRKIQKKVSVQKKLQDKVAKAEKKKKVVKQKGAELKRLQQQKLKNLAKTKKP